MGIIGSIRKHSWIAVALVGVAIVAFIFQDLSKNKTGMTDVGKVNGKALTIQHFNNLVDQEKDNYALMNQTRDIPNEVERQFRERVWQKYLYETVFGPISPKSSILPQAFRADAHRRTRRIHENSSWQTHTRLPVGSFHFVFVCSRAWRSSGRTPRIE